MRLGSLLFEEDFGGLRLKSARLIGLGQVVALFGPNGAGKSRLLRVVRDRIERDMSFFREESGEGTREKLEAQLRLYERQLRDASAVRVAAGDDDAESLRRRERERLAKAVTSAEHAVCTWRKRKEQLHEYVHKPDLRSILVDLTLHAAELLEVDAYLRTAMMPSLHTLSQVQNTKEMVNFATPFFHGMVYAAYEANNPSADQTALGPWLSLYEAARELLRKMMRMELGFSQSAPIGVIPTFNGRAMRIAELSDGQKLVLSHAAFLLRALLRQGEPGQKRSFEGAVIILDEPEVHLHPGAVIELVERLREVVGETGQIWIATHLASLLPYLKTNEIWMMDKSEVLAAGLERGHEALELLVGSAERVERMRDWVQEPFRWAAARFAADCLLKPGQKEFREGDPQMFQISRVLEERVKGGKKACVLDYGAGKGRLAAMIGAVVGEEGMKNVEYVAVEPDEGLHEQIRGQAGGMMADCGVMRSLDSLPGRFGGKVDVAVLCNVLHEVRATRWRVELEKLLGCLAEDGALVICEDEQMTVGERPNELGYVVLGGGEIQTLFGLEKEPRMLRHPEERYRERLLCVEVLKVGAKVTGESVRAAVSDLQGRLKGLVRGLVRELRTNPAGGDAKAGRMYGMWSQMLVNCWSSLEELG